MTNKIDANTKTNIAESSFDPFVPLTSQSLFWRAHYLKPSPALGALPLLFWLTECLRPQLSVTLGLADAVPHFALCQGVGKLGSDGICFGVDITPIGRPSAHSEGAQEEAKDLLPSDILRYNEQHYSEFSQLLTGDHDHCSRLLEDSVIDMLVVSEFADQSLQESLDKHWLPRLSKRGVVLFLAGGERLGDYIERLTKGSGSFALDAEKRVCLALHGDQHGDRLQRMGQLRVGKPGYLAVRNVFMRVGELHSNAIQLERLDETEDRDDSGRTHTDGALEELQVRLDEKTALSEQLASELKHKASAVAMAQSEVFDSKLAIDKLREESQDKILALTEDHTRAQTRLEVVEADSRTREEAAQKKIDDLRALVAAQKLSMLERTQAYTDEIEAAVRKAEEAEAAQTKADERAEALEASLKSATDRAAGLEQSLTKERSEAIAQSKALSDKLKATNTSLAHRLEELAVLGREMEHKDRSMEEVRAELSESANRFAELEQVMQTGKAETASLRTQLEEAGNSLAQRTNENEGLRQELAGRTVELADARRHSAELAETLGRTADQASETQSSVQGKLDAALRKLRTAQQKLSAVEQDRDEAYHRVRQLEHSTSWRVTAPLRRASLMVRGDKGGPSSGPDIK